MTKINWHLTLALLVMGAILIYVQRQTHCGWRCVAKTLFVLVAIAGAILIQLEIKALRTSDSVPRELANLGGYGLVMVVAGIIGEICAWLLP